MMVGQTEGDGCPQGSSGCACYGNGTCDAMLSCAEAENVCVPSGCEPGTMSCVCAEDGSCEGALHCVGSVCRPEMPDTTESASSGDETHEPTTSTAETSASSTTEPSGEESSTDSGSAESSTGGPEDCDALSCDQCAECVVDPGNSCAELAVTCEAEPGCLSTASCMEACGVEGICLDDCCVDTTAIAVEKADALNVCRADHCATACPDYPNALCSG